jgi:small nuclear ribonucleoprotein (snRNP)-like protein
MNNNAGQKKAGGGAPKRESILELAKMMDAAVRVKCLGGRELKGTLRGYDDLVNIVLDDCDEFLRGRSMGMDVHMFPLSLTIAFDGFPNQIRTIHSELPTKQEN